MKAGLRPSENVKWIWGPLSGVLVERLGNHSVYSGAVDRVHEGDGGLRNPVW